MEIDRYSFPNSFVERLEKGKAIHIDSLNEASEFTGTWNELVDLILPHIPQLADRFVWDTFGGILLTRLRDVHGSKITGILGKTWLLLSI